MNNGIQLVRTIELTHKGTMANDNNGNVYSNIIDECMHSCKHTAKLSCLAYQSLTFSQNAPEYISLFFSYPVLNKEGRWGKHICLYTYLLPPPSLSFALPLLFCNSCCVFVLAALHSLFDVVSRSPELQSLATLSVISRPAVSLASIDSF